MSLRNRNVKYFDSRGKARMGANTSQTDRNEQETKSSRLEIVFFSENNKYGGTDIWNLRWEPTANGGQRLETYRIIRYFQKPGKPGRSSFFPEGGFLQSA